MAMMAFPIGSKEEKALNRALSSLSAVFAKPQDEALVPAAVIDIAQQARARGPMAQAPSPGLIPQGASAPLPTTTPPSGGEGPLQ
jgi:hypothetical protein